jgi:hypothetical protein
MRDARTPSRLVRLAGPWLAVTIACAATAAPAHAAGFGAGAATVDISPRPVSVGDVNGLAACGPAFSGDRIWADDEPYTDTNQNHRYDDGEPLCDKNANGRRDQIFTSGATVGSPIPATAVHDPLHARAFAISEGAKTAVVVSVTAQGLFNTYVDRMVARAKKLEPSITDMVVSADHNESSPDTIGIYGGPAPDGAPAGLRSGIDDYYMAFLVERVAQAAAQAARAIRPASLRAHRFRLPGSLSIRLSDNWPTTGAMRVPTAIDPKVGLLQARDAAGAPIFTVMSLAAHNQEIGHFKGRSELSSDWPGPYETAIRAGGGGEGIYLVGDNGSQEDPGPEPLVDQPGTYAKSEATGKALAAATFANVPGAQPLRAGAIAYRHTELCVPIENNLFKAAAVAGLFAERETFVQAGATCIPAGRANPPDSLMTTVGLLDVGPDLQLLLNPGEAFPGLLLGSPWTFADVPVECNTRANPPVPTWRLRATYRFQVGLANDLIGYELPAWAYISEQGALTTPDTGCVTGSGGKDSKGHQHKLESEGVGPTASNAVASELTKLAEAAGADPAAVVAPGRYVRGDGSLSQFPAGAQGIVLPKAGVVVGAADVARFGSRAVDATGAFMDFDGQPQAGPDVTTRGMIVRGADGCVVKRYYVDVFPAAAAGPALGAKVARAAAPGPPACDAAGPGCTSQRIVLRLGSAHGGPIISVRAYVNGKLLESRRGRRLTRLTLRVPTAPGAARVRVDTRTRAGTGRRSVRTLTGCGRTAPRTTRLRARRQRSPQRP